METSFSDLLSRGRFVLGGEVAAFEREYAAFSQSQYCISVGNGLDALTLALHALGIGVEDEVIVPSHTCFATWLAVDRVGARPVPVEVNQHYVIDVNRIETSITPKTKAIIPVHLYGYPCDMESIMAVANKWQLRVVEDNAQGQGAYFDKKITGSWGDVNATSFYPTKNLGALGDGGAVTTNSAVLQDKISQLRNYGAIEKDVFKVLGVNSRLDELQAAFLRSKLEQLSSFQQNRNRLAGRYHDALAGVGDLILPSLGDDRIVPVFHLYVVQTNERERLRDYLREQQIETAVHYPVAIHRQEAFAKLGLAEGSLPIAERLSKTVLSLPLWPGLTEQQQDRVIAAINLFFATTYKR